MYASIYKIHVYYAPHINTQNKYTENIPHLEEKNAFIVAGLTFPKKRSQSGVLAYYALSYRLSEVFCSCTLQ